MEANDEQVPHGGENVHPETLVNGYPSSISGALAIATGFIQTYGWFLVLGVIGLVYVKSKLQPSINQWWKRREQEYDHKKRDPAKEMTKMEQMDASRHRLQEQHDAQAALYAEKKAVQDVEKAKERIKDWDRHQEGKGYRSKMKPKEETDLSSLKKNKPKSPSLRPNDYSPLSRGGGGSMGYRPSRQQGQGGGA